ncbi:MAG TPA: triose-phosphate isomerase [Longimicrobiales bacterium]|nr:triose-phosphate isomerase [Longimicrobiales bacterium]
MSVMKPVLAGNWKMHKGPKEATSFLADFLARHHARTDATVIFFPPAISLTAARQALHGREDVALGVQNIHWEPAGAFTGEVAAGMAAQAGAAFALAGHSERRHTFGETDAEVGRKVAAALGAGLTPVACVGETLDEREAGRLQQVLQRQLDAIIDALPGDAADSLLLAYEPVWAIGTGKTATPADASEAHGILRERVAGRFGEDAAAALPILYGGSVKPDNAAELLAAPGVDGLLVGGASLDAAAFAAICRA